MPRATVAAVVSLVLVVPGAYAQGLRPAAAISGTVTDAGGRAIPGADVTITAVATSRSLHLVTSRDGRFFAPALDPGRYDVTAAHAGFRTVVVRGVDATVGVPIDLRVVLAAGPAALTFEQPAATSASGQPAARAPPVALDRTALTAIPLPTSNVLDVLSLLPGVDAPGTTRAATIFGLPQSAIALTLDGVSNQDNLLKSTDGLFGRIPPMLDLVDAIVLAGPGVPAGAAQGAVQIQLVTRAGTSVLSGSLSDELHNRVLDSNDYFTAAAGLPKNRSNVQETGATVGGPVGRSTRAFFFAGLDTTFGSTSLTRTRTILTPAAAAGLFTYTSTTNGVSTSSTVDVLGLAASHGFLGTADPTIAALLGQIEHDRATTGATMASANPNTSEYAFASVANRREFVPALRFDVDLGAADQLTATANGRVLRPTSDILSGADNAFPGFFGRTQSSTTTAGSVAWRRVWSPAIVTVVSAGGSAGPASFSGVTAAQFAGEDGFNLDWSAFPGTGGLTNVSATTSAQSRRESNWTLDESLDWQRGAHQITLGASFSGQAVAQTSQTPVATATLGDLQESNLAPPATSLFNSTTLPGASRAAITDAQNLYAILTGFVTPPVGSATLDETTNQYTYLGPLVERAREREMGFFAEDTWRVAPGVTIGAGVRWSVDFPDVMMNSVLSTATIADICGVSGTGAGPGGRGCNLFQPGVLTGSPPALAAFASGTSATRTDWRDIAPNVSLAWSPGAATGWARRLLGDPRKATIRASYASAYQRNGLEDFLGVYDQNAGPTVNVETDCAPASFDPMPCLLRNASAFETFAPPAAPARTSFTSLDILDPNLKTPFTRTVTAGLARSMAAGFTLDVRYVGTRGVDEWTTENWNEPDVVQNGFLDEFRHAQTNLEANLAAGRGATFAYEGPNTGTMPLPIYFQLLTLHAASQATNAGLYAGSSSRFADPTLVGQLSLVNPDPLDAARDLSRDIDTATPGIPANFFQLNPALTSADVTTNSGRTSYDSLQVQATRRAGPLTLTAAFTAARRRTSSLDTIARAPAMVIDPAGVPRAVKIVASYALPIGRGERHASSLPAWLNALAGNWSIDATARVETGQVLSLTGVRLVGMTAADLQKAFRIRVDPATKVVSDLPQDIIDNTIRAFSTDATSATGYGALGPPTGRYIAPASSPTCVEVVPGDCGEPHDLIVTGPLVSRVDVRVRKTFRLGARTTLDAEIDVDNVLGAIDFTPVFQASASSTIDQVASAYSDVSNTFDPGGRIGQILIRLRW